MKAKAFPLAHPSTPASQPMRRYMSKEDRLRLSDEIADVRDAAIAGRLNMKRLVTTMTQLEALFRRK